MAGSPNKQPWKELAEDESPRELDVTWAKGRAGRGREWEEVRAAWQRAGADRRVQAREDGAGGSPLGTTKTRGSGRKLSAASRLLPTVASGGLGE